MAEEFNSEPTGPCATPGHGVVPLSECLVRHFDRIVLIVASHTSAKLAGTVGVEDLAHEVIVEALEHRARFEYRGEASFVRWISTLAYRMVCDAVRRVDRAPRTLSIGNDPATAHDVHPSHIPGQTRTPSSILCRDERCRLVREVLAALHERDRAVIRMVQLEGQSLEEVAAAMSCSKDAAAKRLGRALARLAGGLADYCHEHDRPDHCRHR